MAEKKAFFCGTVCSKDERWIPSERKKAFFLSLAWPTRLKHTLHNFRQTTMNFAELLRWWAAGLDGWSAVVMKCYNAALQECWSAGVLECWSAGAGVLVCSSAAVREPDPTRTGSAVLSAY